MTGLLMLVAPGLLYFAAFPLSDRFRPGLRRTWRLLGGLLAFPGSGVSLYFAAYAGDQGGIAAFFFQSAVILACCLLLALVYAADRLGARRASGMPAHADTHPPRDVHFTGELKMTVPSLRERRDQALGAGAELFYDEPIEIVRGEGAYLFDRDGRRYVDLYNNVPCVGHGNVAVARAMAEQQATLNVHSRYLHEGIVSLAERLAALNHDGIESVVFSCSGTEANEVALTLARTVTGQRGIVCTGSAYHGNAGLTGALTFVGDQPVSGREICGFPYPDLYRPLAQGVDEETLAAMYLERVAEAIAHLKREGAGFAGLMICSIFANEGVPDVPAGLMPAIAALVRREGGLVIADEVQSGHGRTGHWWGYQAMGFEPDVVVMGKPMGNGLPLAATAASRRHVEAFRRATDYFNTYASCPLQAAVGMAVLDEIERMDLLTRAREVGAVLLAGLTPYRDSHPLVGDVRGKGLFLSVELVRDKVTREPHPEAARVAANRLKDLGCLSAAAGALNNVLKIRPPLVFGEEHAAEFLEAFSTCMATLDA